METCMKLLGVKNVSELGPKFVCDTTQSQDFDETSDADVCRRSTHAKWRETSTTASLDSRIRLVCGCRSCRADLIRALAEGRLIELWSLKEG